MKTAREMGRRPAAWPHGWHRRFRHSLRWRLVALFLLLALGSTFFFITGTQVALSASYRVLVRPLLSDYVDRLAADIGSPPSVARASELASHLPIAIRIDGPVVHWASQAPRPHWGRNEMGPAGEHYSLLTRTTADGHRIQFGLGEVVWREHHPGSLLLPPFGLLLLTLAAYATVRRLFRPLDDIRAGALRYGDGDFDTPIPVRRRDELGDLATQVNAMASGLQGMLKGQRALLLAISHELRSPLTRARLNTELLADGREREALLRDIALMGELITDLLESERLSAGTAALQREPTDGNALVREVIDQQFAGQAIRMALAEGLPTLLLDRSRVVMLLRNLIDNACRHGADASEAITVTTRAVPDAVEWVVRDHGPGVPPEHLARLAEPFYRPDVARTRGAGGVGLGLYLCQRVAQSHGATMAIVNASPGLKVTVRWPA